jgi:hypothetical protein
MKKEGTTQTEPARDKCDALALVEHVRANPRCLDYQPITHEQAEKLTDLIIPYENDQVAFAFITLLQGIVHAAQQGLLDAESMVRYASHRAYIKTLHYNYAFDMFAALDPNRPRDQRVIRQEF